MIRDSEPDVLKMSGEVRELLLDDSPQPGVFSASEHTQHFDLFRIVDALDSYVSDGQHSDGQHSDGQHSDGQHSDLQHSDGQRSDKQHSDGQHNNGQHSDGQNSDEQHHCRRLGASQHSNGQHSDLQDVLELSDTTGIAPIRIIMRVPWKP